jgi:predicted RNA-binding Zn-ribbon protein involved in translation (DUF1610 family)
MLLSDGTNVNAQNSFKMIVLAKRPIDATIFTKDNFPEKERMEPFFAGEGVLDFFCGSCNHLILKSLRWGQISQAVYKCPKCGAYNRIDWPVKRR